MPDICQKSVEELARIGENENIEFKKGLGERKEILESVCAFANSKGGVILIGVDDNGKILGVELGKGTLEDLVSLIVSSIEPKIYPMLSIEEVKGKKVIKVCINEGNEKPYFFRGKSYVRIGKSNVKLERSGIISLLKQEKLDFGEEISDVDVGKISKRLAEKFAELCRKNRGMNINFSDIFEFAEMLKISKNGKLKNAGVLFFVENPQEIFFHARIKAIFEKGGKIADAREIGGSLIEQIEGAMEFLKKHLNIVEVYEGATTKRVLEIPESALREAIVNAVAHRDYRIASSIVIRVTPGFVEIINPGKLPEPLKVEDLKKRHISIPVNPSISRLLFLAGYVEEIGRGTNKIIREVISSGLPEPLFEQGKGYFRVLILRKSVNRRLLRALKEIEKRGRITRKEYEKIFKVSDRTARKDLKDLVEMGFLRKAGKGRNTYYYVA